MFFESLWDSILLKGFVFVRFIPGIPGILAYYYADICSI